MRNLPRIFVAPRHEYCTMPVGTFREYLVARLQVAEPEKGETKKERAHGWDRRQATSIITSKIAIDSYSTVLHFSRGRDKLVQVNLVAESDLLMLESVTNDF